LVAGAAPEQMIDAADKAMYARKNERRGVPR
jgi:PleD family two-component response regulator